MKPAPLLLALSAAANLAFGGWFLVRAAGPAHRPVASTAASSVPTVATELSPFDTPVTPETWASFQAGSDTDYVDRLRLEGFPPEIIQVLVTERVRARFKDRLDALRPKTKDAWDSYFRPDAELGPEARTARRAIQREMNEAIRDALGGDFETLNPIDRAHRLRTLGDLPRLKADQVTAINADYDELAARVRDRARGLLLKEDRELLRAFEREKRADLAATLTPEELLEYDLRGSPSAFAVRGRLTYFNATEEEFRALTLVQLEFDRTYGTDHLSAAELARRTAAGKELAARMQSVLGPERAADYQLVTDPSYRDTAYFLTGYSYEPALAGQMVALQRAITERAAAIREHPVYTAEVRDAELAALYREATAKLSGTLSPKALEAYQNRDGGKWLQQLRPGSAAPAKP